jgi:hypothetical protein
MDPERNGQCLVVISSRPNDVEVQTVFANWVVPLVGAVAIALHILVRTMSPWKTPRTYRTGVLGRLFAVCPAHIQACWILESETTDRSLRVRDPQEEVLVILRVVYTFVRSVLNFQIEQRVPLG